MIVGIDEAGRGPLAGPVVGCALYLKKDPPFQIKDSKELSACSREKIFPWLVENAVLSVSAASPAEIDQVNILEATFLTFNRAIKNLLCKAPYLKDAEFIIDGNLFRTDLSIQYRCIEKADKTIKAVSCASIVAKVTRDYFMANLDYLYPQWNFLRHKGYPTSEHFSLMKQNVITPFHRQSFSPCRESKRNRCKTDDSLA